MRKIILLASFLFVSSIAYLQCIVSASVDKARIACGGCVELTAQGSTGLSVFSETFDSGTPTGWSFTQAADYSNPCSAGVNGTPYMWMGDLSVNPRSMETLPFDLSLGGTICFDMLYATQGNASPCEGPDLPDEGVYLQYSVNGGSSWVTIQYHDPLGGNNSTLTNWNNYCYPIPAGAMTTSTQIRWYQDTVSGAIYDHWGIDNVDINLNDPLLTVTWLHDGYTYGAGNSGGIHPTPQCLTNDSVFIVEVTNGTVTCYDTVSVKVNVPIINLNLSPQDTIICERNCFPIDLNYYVLLDSARIKKFANIQPVAIDQTGGGITNVFSSVDIDLNVQGLNMQNVSPNSIKEVCISGLSAYRNGFLGTLDISGIDVELECPSGAIITLVPSAVTTGGGALGYNNGYLNTCFTPTGPSIASGTVPYTGTWATQDPFNNLAGCTANGIWKLRMSETQIFANLKGMLEGFSITFCDDSISYPGLATWNHTSAMTNPYTNPVVCALNDTSYVLTVTDSNNCASKSDTVTVVVLPAPNAGTDSAYSTCALSPIDLFTYLGGNPGVGGTWLNPNGNVITMPITPGIDTVGNYIYFLDNGTCADSAIVNFSRTVQAVFLGPDSNICAGDSIQLTAFAPNSSYQWNTGDSTSSITVGIGGVYWALVTDTITGCMLVDTVSVSIVALSFAGNDSIYASCSPAPVDLFTYLGGNPVNTGVWIDPNNNFVLMPITPFVSMNGNYKYIVTNSTGCSDTAIVNFMTLTSGQSPLLRSDTSICNGEVITLNVGIAIPNSTYLWSNGATTSSINVNTTGLYWVNVTDTISACLFTDTVLITVLPKPFAGRDSVYASCSTIPVDLFTYLGGNPVSNGFWIDPNNNGVAMPLTPLVSVNGNYQYVVVNSSGCADTATVNFNAIAGEASILFAQNDTIFCFDNSSLNLVPISYSGITSYSWSTGETASAIVVNTPGLYWVEVTTANCGNYRDSINVLTCEPIVEMPNVFTPNNDGVNDDFYPITYLGVSKASLSIFNRWGTKVYETTNVTSGWDGRTEGKKCSEGVYYWILKYEGSNQDKKELTGNVTLK